MIGFDRFGLAFVLLAGVVGLLLGSMGYSLEAPPRLPVSEVKMEDPATRLSNVSFQRLADVTFDVGGTRYDLVVVGEPTIYTNSLYVDRFSITRLSPGEDRVWPSEMESNVSGQATFAPFTNPENSPRDYRPVAVDSGGHLIWDSEFFCGRQGVIPISQNVTFNVYRELPLGYMTEPDVTVHIAYAHDCPHR